MTHGCGTATGTIPKLTDTPSSPQWGQHSLLELGRTRWPTALRLGTILSCKIATKGHQNVKQRSNRWQKGPLFIAVKERYCIGTWNVGSMNQGKLEVVKQEMARVNVNILGISELKWTGMGEFNSDDHYIYYCGQESLRRNGVDIMVNKRVRNAVLGCNLKNDRMISSFPRQTIQYHSNPSLCPNQ